MGSGVFRGCGLRADGNTGLRPFGVSFIYAGFDAQREFQLYQSNPSGNYGGWKATSVGANNASAQSLLKQDYKEDCTLKEACAMAVKVLSKTMDSTTLSSEKSGSFQPSSLSSLFSFADRHSRVCHSRKGCRWQDLSPPVERRGNQCLVEGARPCEGAGRGLVEHHVASLRYLNDGLIDMKEPSTVANFQI